MIPAVLLTLSSAVAQKQTTVEQSKDNSIHVEFKTDKDGKQATFKKDYKSREEMLADKDLKEFVEKEGLDVHFYDDANGKGAHAFMWDDTRGGKGGVHILSDADSLKSFFFDGSGTFRFDGADGDQSYVFKFPDNMAKGFWMFGDGDSLFTKKLMPFDLDSMREAFDMHFLKPGEDNAFFYSWDGDDDGNHTTKIVMRKKVTISRLEENEASLDNGANKKMSQLEPLDISYYPNPSSGRFTLKMELKSASPMQVSITDLSGKIIYEEEVKTFDGKYRKEFDLSEQPSGIYLLQVVQGNSRMVRKIMIN